MFTGGVKAVEDIIKALETFLKNPGTVLKDALQTAGRKTVAAIDTIIELISKLARKLKNGAQELFNDFKQFIDDIFKWIEEVLGVENRDAGMAENISVPSLKITVEEFEAGLAKLAKIKPEKALEYLEEALIYFNHHVVDGRIVQVSNTNCVNVVECVEEFLRTGKIRLAKPSRVQEIEKLERIYQDSFKTYVIPSLKNIMKEGERGIIYGIKRNKNEVNHVFNVIKKNNELIFKDAQIFSGKGDLRAGYESFKYLKTK